VPAKEVAVAVDTHDPTPRSWAEAPGTARPVSQEVRDRLAEPLVAAACLALRECAGTEAVVRAVSWQTFSQTRADVTAVLRLRGASEGALTLSCPLPTAAALAGRMLNEVAQDPDEALVRDCLGELANVIAGQAKALLAGTPYHFAFSTPSVGTGVGPEIWPRPGGECLVIAFDSDVGDVVLRLYQNL
jgi:chemotaxis protein CheX